MRYERAEFSRKTKREAWERSGGRCEGVIDGESLRYVGDLSVLPQALDDRRHLRRCDSPLDRGAVYDHIDPSWYSGKDDLENCQALCLSCNRDKTGQDQTNISKTKRITDKAIRAKTSKRPFRGWRNMKGEIVWNDKR